MNHTSGAIRGIRFTVRLAIVLCLALAFAAIPAFALAAPVTASDAGTYTIAASAGAHGSISPSGDQLVASGASSPLFIITADVGYHANVVVDGVSLGDRSSFQFTNVTENHTISAVFAPDTFVLQPSAGANGSISPSTDQVVSAGSNVTFAITPASGYHVADVLVDGVSAGAVGTYTFTNVLSDHTISATFATNTVVNYTITASAGAGGSIAPSGAQTVASGSNAVFAITPSSGYRVASVLVDGVSVGAVTSYTFTGVQANHTIAATFATNTVVNYTITASAGAGGAIAPSGAQTVASGSNAVVTITPDSGYYVASLLVDGVPVGAATSYTFTGVTANHTISATFAANAPGTFAVVAWAGAHGSISPSGDQVVTSGANSPLFIITADVGYHANVVVDGVSLGDRSSFQFTNVTENHTISAVFAPDTFVLQPSAGANGSISPSTDQVVSAGSNVTFAITPASGYHVADVLVDGVSAGAVGTYTFTGVQANHSIAASFATNTVVNYTITASAGTGGAISPSGAVSVASGATQAFTITPASGYHVADVLVGGVSVGAVSTYTFTGVTANHTISATFAADGSGPTPTSITIKPATTSTYIGRTVRLSGLVTPQTMIGVNIVVYVMKPGKTYWTYSSNRTVYTYAGSPASWMYPYYFKPGMARGYYKFKARCPAPGFASSVGFATSESPMITIRVR